GLKIRAEKAFSASSCRKTLEIRLSILPRGKPSAPGGASRPASCLEYQFLNPFLKDDPVTAMTGDATRRDFLYVASGAMAAVGAAAAAWPFIDQMNPSAAVLALASTEVDL